MTKMQSTRGNLYSWMINVKDGGLDDYKTQLLDFAFMIMTNHPHLRQQSQELNVTNSPDDTLNNTLINQTE